MSSHHTIFYKYLKFKLSKMCECSMMEHLVHYRDIKTLDNNVKACLEFRDVYTFTTPVRRILRLIMPPQGCGLTSSWTGPLSWHLASFPVPLLEISFTYEMIKFKVECVSVNWIENLTVSRKLLDLLKNLIDNKIKTEAMK